MSAVGVATGAVRRNTELGLLILSTLVIVGAYVLASLPEDGEIPTNLVPFLGFVIGLQLAAHVAMRRLAPFADPLLLPLASLLSGIGYVFIVRIDEARANPAGLAGLQSVWFMIAVGAFIGTLLVVRDLRVIERLRYTAGLVGLALLLLPLAPVIGRNINGARIWVSIGPMNFQPNELAKIALAVFFAGYLAEKRELLSVNRMLGRIPVPQPKHVGPVLAAWGAALLVMAFQNDLGPAILTFALFLVLFWVATERGTYLLAGTALFAGGVWLAHSLFDHVRDRFTIWLDPWPVAQDEGFQVVQSMFAFADGGLTGQGLNLGIPTRIPEVQNDFIFAAIGEELGLLGATGIVVSFLLIIAVGLGIAVRANSPFQRLLATGLTTLIGLQAFIIMAGVTRLMPLTGITLPFVSFGGSSLISNFVLLALLLRISHASGEREGEQQAAMEHTQALAW
jgi:peptidoglycan glycosyltransferase